MHIGQWPNSIDKKRVKLLGIMNEDQIASFLRKGHLFLFPSQDEACPNVVIEALSSGLPVLYHNSGGTPEICSHGKYGTPIPVNLDLPKLNSFIHKVISEYSHLRGEILDNIHTFSFENCFNLYIRHLKKIVP